MRFRAEKTIGHKGCAGGRSVFIVSEVYIVLFVRLQRNHRFSVREEERPCPKVIWASTLCIVHCYFNIFICSIYQRKAAFLQVASTQILTVLEFSAFIWCRASTRPKCDGLLSHLRPFNLSLCLASVLVRSSPSREGLRK